ncbi:hypothetical protein [Bacillus sp. EB01]|uniref:hypothetical protein n=1 Tax=Bacillus sp. EB01 TaxID=1347086 RepID=UPI0012DF737C|nr:hypothetical protein [Bacillus sp. EB01]
MAEKIQSTSSSHVLKDHREILLIKGTKRGWESLAGRLRREMLKAAAIRGKRKNNS